MSTYFRVHPNINFARVGSSKKYYLAPETGAGEVIDAASGLFGGLPIKKGTENTLIDDSDFRDDDNNPVRQAARFRIYGYDQAQSKYPSEDPGKEIKIGDMVGGKTVAEIVWQVHLANKKANNYQITGVNNEGEKGEYGIESYSGTIPLPPIRNADFAGGLDDPLRRKQLVIDAGPRCLLASSNGAQTLNFDATTTPSYNVSGKIQPQKTYPVSFPSDNFDLLQPLGAIDTLGEMTIEANTGRLIVAGGYGRASGIIKDGIPPNLCDAIDNDDWFDDTSDGPVNATIVFTDGSTIDAVHGWVVCTDPSYAPQTRNIVSTWDDMYSAWVEKLQLVPSMYADGKYIKTYQAAFDQDVLPVFHGAFLQRWNTNLPQKAIVGHEYMASIKPSDDPAAKIPSFPQLIRDPSDDSDEGVSMPLALGDAQKSFLSVSPTQYFLLMQWYAGTSIEQGAPLGGGEKLDRVVLENCLGGRYSPGIDLTFIVRDENLFVQHWQGDTGPFRINQAALDYATASSDSAFLGVGYVPLKSVPVEPGDLCKFMSQPWHTDYNSCATHTPDPNPKGNNTLYWSWPAQRPVNVYPKSECTYDSSSKTWNLGGQLYSVRGDEGKGTATPYPQQQGRYQCYYDYVQNWHKVGFVIQGSQIADDNGGNYGADKFLEVASLYTSDGDLVTPWPQATIDGYKAPKDCGPPKSAACPID